jgi:hypothetical protein
MFCYKKSNMKLCEAPIDVLRGAIRSYQKAEHPPTGKMKAEQLIEYMRAHPKASKMIPKSYREDKQADIPLSIVRRTILAYRRKHHPAPSRMRRAELERYMRKAKIRPIGKELAKLKRDKCEKPDSIDNVVTLNPKRAKKKLDMDRVMALADSDSDDEPVPVARRTRGRPKGSKKKKSGVSNAGLRAVNQMLPDLESRAVQMDADDDSLAW